MTVPTSPNWASIAVGDELPPLEVPLTASVIVAGAIATRDFMPVHHDKAYANAQGAPDVFMNILTSNGYVARFVTDWAGPDARLRSISIRLGAPAIPNTTLRFTGTVARTEHPAGTNDGGGADRTEGIVEVALRGVTEIGEHLSGTVVVTLPVR
jgi:acyl dehydratase